MKRIFYNSKKKFRSYSFLTTFYFLLVCSACNQAVDESAQAAVTGDEIVNQIQQKNTLTEKEKSEGWKLLFDGETSKGWTGTHQEGFPEKGWKIEEGTLSMEPDTNDHSSGGDIITIDQYNNFELSLEFKIPEGANSGIKYFVVDSYPGHEGDFLGLEYQILDDERHPDAKNGRNGNRKVASLYDLIPAEDKRMTIGEWNQARIVANENRVEHWLNGNKVVEFVRGSDEYKALVAESKYKDLENFGQSQKGHILLQGHGDTVHFRNIKIRNLSGS